MWPEVPASTAGYHPEVVELHVFVPTTDGAHVSRLVEDDGLTTASPGGACHRTTFTLTREGDTVRLRAQVEGRGYPEFRRTAFHLHVHGATPRRVELDGVELDGVEVAAGDDGAFVLPVAAQPFTAVFEV
jgi:alpha-glucosidase